MSAVNDFFRHKMVTGGAVLVASFLAAYSPSHADNSVPHYDMSALGGIESLIVDGEAQSYVTGDDGLRSLRYLMTQVNQDMDAIENASRVVDTALADGISAGDYKQMQKALKSAMSTVDGDVQLLTDFQYIDVSRDMPNFDDVLILAQRNNQRVQFINDMNMRVKELYAAVKTHNNDAIVSAAQDLHTQIAEQEYVEDQLRSKGIDTGRL